jgi:hypothetical protein
LTGVLTKENINRDYQTLMTVSDGFNEPQLFNFNFQIKNNAPELKVDFQ